MISIKSKMNTYSMKHKRLSLNESFVRRNLLRNNLQKLTSRLEHRSFPVRTTLFIFTSLSMAVGILIVCLSSKQEKNATCQLTFRRSVQRSIGYDSHPHKVAIGDLNKDGHLDMIVANSGTDSMIIFLGYGNGTFASQITYSTGLRSHPVSIAVEDINNDNQLDIIVANYGTNSIGVFLGNVKGSFSSQMITSLGSSRPLSLIVGEFNNDNQVDIAVTNYGTSSLAVLLGSNNGSFQVGTIYDMGYDSTPYSLALAHFNNDNRSDIAVVNYGTSHLIVLLANENGSFVSEQYSTGSDSHPSAVAIGDFNTDNQLDIAVTNSNSSNVGIFFGHGNGSFTDMIIYSTPFNSRPWSIDVSDLDNDTHLDIIAIDSGNNNVLVLKGDGHGKFSITTTHSTGYNSDPTSLAIGDFDNDNKPDIAITNNGINNILVLSAYNVYPDAHRTTYSTGINSKPIFVAVGDINDDNFSDIIVANSGTDNVGIFINLGNGTFANQVEHPTGIDSQPFFVTVDDVNNDSRLDIIVVMKSLNEIRILFGYGNGSFSSGDSYLTENNSYPESIAVGDLNNDYNLDIVVGNYMSGTVGIFYGYGNGSFRSVILHSVGNHFHPISVAVNDLNNDKILDIVVSDDVNGGIGILFGYGNESFEKVFLIPTNDDRPRCLVIDDLNNDHQLDIVYVSVSLSSLGILFGYGNGTFENVIKYFIGQGTWPYSVTLGHFNNDTLLDIAIVNAYGFNIDIFFGFGNGSFAVQKTFSTGFNSIPTSITFTDFNNDNQLDIVITNHHTNNIGIFLIDYQIDFLYEKSYFTGSGSHPYSVAIGDFNNDHRSDIVVANSGNDNIELLAGYNKGTFMNKTKYSTGFGSFPQFVSVADFNKDKQVDIAVVNNRNDSIDVFFGNGNGAFDRLTVHSTGPYSFPSSMAVGDFNQDNWIDIVVTNNGTNTIGVYLGFDYATFTNETIYISGPPSVPLYVDVGDFNNDQQWDIIVANAQVKSVGVYLGYGNGTFTEQRSFSTGDYSPGQLAVADFNSDNQLDIVVLYRDENSIGIFTGYGNGTFQMQTIYSTGKSSYPRSVTVGDINKDNILDIVVANRGSNNIGVFIGYGNGSFTEQMTYLLPDRSFPAWAAIADLNKDNILDLVVANYAQNNIGLMLGYGNGTFTDMRILFTGNNSGPYMVAIDDVNNDTWMDIAVANSRSQNVGIFFGNSNGTFSSQTTYSTGSQSSLYSIVIADLNNDTQLDVIVSDRGNGNGNIGVFYGYGDGNFIPIKIYPTGLNSDPTSIVVCDFNNDNRLDLAITYANEDSIGIMLRQQSEPFATPVLFLTGDDSHPQSVVVGDFNHDDREDIAVANSGTNNIGIFLGNGNGIFAPQQTYSTGFNSVPVSIAVGDFNNDTHLDVVVANSQSNTMIIFRGYGNGSVILFSNISTGMSSIPSSVAVKDLNGDNYLDIVLANFGSNDVLVFYGSGNGTFFEPKSYSLGYGARPLSVTTGDINNDHLLDIIVANYGTDYVEVLFQSC